MELLDRVRTRMEAKGLQPTTIERVTLTFRQFLEIVGVKQTYGRDSVLDFLAEKRREGISGTTLHNYYRYMKIVFDRMDWPWELTTKDLPKVETPYQPYYTPEDWKRLEDAAERVVNVKGKYGDILRLRNRALLRLSEATMLRRIEIMRLNVEDYKKPFIRVRNPAKHSEYTDRILDSETCQVLDKYLETRKRTKSPALFVVGRGGRAKRLSTRGLSDVMKRIREEAGIDKPRAGWHANRRGGLTAAHRGGSGASEKALSSYTGITTEMIRRYIQLDHGAATEAFVSNHPFFREDQKKLEDYQEEQIRRLLEALDPETRKRILEEEER